MEVMKRIRLSTTHLKHYIRIKLLLGILICSYVLLCTTCFSITVKAAPRAQTTDEKIVIVIDPGHGGENFGTIENGFLEKSMTLITAQAMYDELICYDNVEVYMTRTEDIDLSLKARAEYAAAVNADFLFSIHYNASLAHDLFGSEVWISATPPYNAYGYQFGYQQMLTMQDMGLYLRGIKTKLNDAGNDYYGIIRESTALSIPSAIIEHCHVDEERDFIFCDEEEELIAFGKADALAVAKYFGLKSTSLGVDYSEDGNMLPNVNEKNKVQSTLKDESAPDVCMVELIKIEEDTGMVSLTVSAADYDSPLIYYDYSIDGGNTYSPLNPWPNSNTFDGTYQDTFTLDIQIPSGIQPDIIVRAYNLFDAFTPSNELPVLHIFRYGEEYEKDNASLNTVPESNINKKDDKKLPGTQTFSPTNSEPVVEENKETTFSVFLKLCLLVVLILFMIIIVSQTISYYSRRKRRRQRKKDSGNHSNHNR